MTKIFHGLLWERILWLTILLSCIANTIGTVTYFTYGFYVEYRHYDISTEFRLKVSPAIKLPTITFCENAPLSFKSMCYKDKDLSGFSCAKQTMFSDKIDPIYSLHIAQHKKFPQCVTFNEFGNLTSNDIGEIYFKNSYYSGYIIAFIHDHNDFIGKDEDMKLYVTNSQENNILLNDKQVISHLPSPYPSNCSSGQFKDNVLTGPYTYNKCHYTCKIHD